MGVQEELVALKRKRAISKGKFTRKVTMCNEGINRGGEALQAVKGSEGNYDEMIQRLDDKFGNSRKIVDLVVGELRSLKKIYDDDTKGFIKMVDQVEQCWLDLKKKERKILEYMNSNVRSSGSDNKATVHHVDSTVENELELIKLVKKIGEEQSIKNKEFESCIVNLTEMVKGIKPKADSKGIGCLLHNSIGHDITECYKFNGCGSKESFEIIKGNGICFRCLRGYHPARSCKVGTLCDVIIEGKGPCNRNHHPLLHSDRVENSIHKAISEKGFAVLLNISMVNSKNMPVNVLWDPGADISFITNRMAKKLGLSGKHINLSMIKVGNAVEYHSSNEYCVPLIDKSGKVWNVNAVGINEITAKIKKVDLSRVSELFEGISNLELNRPHGEINMLIGANYCEILPRVVETNKGLQLLENQFGLSIRGRHDEITNQVNSSNHVFVRIHKLFKFSKFE
ncbi:uncharacterized protein LOC135199676 [Macrobrachium nipponense]|uniref:uncharacterized protein LOC135199676 n=1 Tax=Macrobrachium nipponense TaxID=159736 RepID=UPI0030C7A2F2